MTDKYRELQAVANAVNRSFDEDAVNHPKHYTSHPSGIEAIQITEHMDFCIGNAVKYLFRAGIKDEAKTIEDLKKAAWYINRKIALLEKDE